jgi:CheY-like chemotaxis protein
MDHLRLRTAEGRPVPTVAVTAYASPEDAARVRASGFRAHLAKPVDPRVVVETLARLVRETAHEGEEGGGGPPGVEDR